MKFMHAQVIEGTANFTSSVSTLSVSLLMKDILISDNSVLSF